MRSAASPEGSATVPIRPAENTATPARELRLGELTREVPIDWDAPSYLRLEEALDPYVRWIRHFLDSGNDLPSHIENSGSIAMPIGESLTPDEMFRALGPGVSFDCREYEEYWITVHYPNPEPVVTLLPKRLPGTPPQLLDLCRACGDTLGADVGGTGGMFLAWLLPGFSWAMHTDHDNAYEQVSARVQVPLLTNPSARFVWGRILEGRREQWIVSKHLERGKAHYVRVDVPHTVVNSHATHPRLHLILDVHDRPHRATR